MVIGDLCGELSHCSGLMNPSVVLFGMSDNIRSLVFPQSLCFSLFQDQSEASQVYSYDSNHTWAIKLLEKPWWVDLD